MSLWRNSRFGSRTSTRDKSRSTATAFPPGVTHSASHATLIRYRIQLRACALPVAQRQAHECTCDASDPAIATLTQDAFPRPSNRVPKHISACGRHGKSLKRHRQTTSETDCVRRTLEIHRYHGFDPARHRRDPDMSGLPSTAAHRGLRALPFDFCDLRIIFPAFMGS